MKSLKGNFVSTNILMIVISGLLAIVMTLLVLLVYSLAEPEGFTMLLKTADSMLDGEFSPSSDAFYYIVTWAILAGLIVLATCVAFSFRLSGRITEPVKILNNAAKSIADGDLNFDVLVSEESRELSELGESIESIRKRLKESAERELAEEEDRNMFIAGFSHDMRTPVATIKGYAEGLRDGIADTDEKKQKYIDTIYAKSLVLEKLLDNLTEYSELANGRMQYILEYMDMTAYLKDVCEEYKNDVEAAGLNFTLNTADCELVIVGDRNKLKRVLDNLVSNAIKYNIGNGSISITETAEEKGVLIEVSDTGMGIARKDMDRIFEGFYRGDSARSNVKGNGLGLAIAKQIVENLHGKIWIKSEERHGTDVYIYLPLREKEKE